MLKTLRPDNNRLQKVPLFISPIQQAERIKIIANHYSACHVRLKEAISEEDYMYSTSAQL